MPPCPTCMDEIAQPPSPLQGPMGSPYCQGRAPSPNNPTNKVQIKDSSRTVKQLNKEGFALKNQTSASRNNRPTFNHRYATLASSDAGGAHTMTR